MSAESVYEVGNKLGTGPEIAKRLLPIRDGLCDFGSSPHFIPDIFLKFRGAQLEADVFVSDFNRLTYGFVAEISQFEFVRSRK
jgi:hypothetical protein